jgi:RNA polymerase sigma factor (sigma-70 family)
MPEPLLDTSGIEALLARARTGDAVAQNALFSRLHARILAVAKKRVWDAEAAEDIAQETMRTALEKYHDADLSHGLLPWLFTILHHKVGNYLKRRRTERAHLDAEAAWAKSTWSVRAADEVGYLELLTSVEEALVLLPDECRKILRLLLGGAGRREICAAFEGQPIGTIDSRISRCRSRLLDYLEETSNRRGRS